MWMISENGLSFMILTTVLAVALDFVLGDPASIPHPVRLVGKILDAIEPKLRSLGANLKLTGLAATILLSACVYFSIYFLTTLKAVGIVATIYFSYAGLALGCLLKDGRKVESLISEDKLPEARIALSMLVSRDTSTMNSKELRASLAETISENLNDAFVAPLFYLVLLGPAAMWVYKTVSTMDSMWGYKTNNYRKLGWAPARTDDILAFIPSRITALAMVAAAAFSGLEWRKALANVRRDAAKMESPNAGWPMSAAAWIFSARMGGKITYFGQIKEKPRLGPDGAWDSDKINELLRLCRFSGLGTCAVFLVSAALML